MFFHVLREGVFFPLLAPVSISLFPSELSDPPGPAIADRDLARLMLSYDVG